MIASNATYAFGCNTGETTNLIPATARNHHAWTTQQTVCKNSVKTDLTK